MWQSRFVFNIQNFIPISVSHDFIGKLNLKRSQTPKLVIDFQTNLHLSNWKVYMRKLFMMWPDYLQFV